uniref:Arginyl tRNA synthetase N-terminal domain-containing protein n=1 Tax=Glossina austeni TaxID=7395 RepID=A0A1A9VD97_GLOAU
MISCVNFPHLAGTSGVITSVSSNAAKFCDYQCNSAMSLSKTFKADQGFNKSPCDVAQDIIKHTTSSPLIDKLETAGAGFINVFLKNCGNAAVIKILAGSLSWLVQYAWLDPMVAARKITGTVSLKSKSPTKDGSGQMKMVGAVLLSRN